MKPMVRSGRDLRMFRPEGYCRELDLPEQEIDGVPALQWYAEHGGGGFISWFTGDAFSYPLPLGIEARFQKLVDASHEAGLKVLPYVVGFLISQECRSFATTEICSSRSRNANSHMTHASATRTPTTTTPVSMDPGRT